MVFDEKTPRLEGIVIRAYPSRDSDLVLKIFSPSHGMLSAVAKSNRGSSKKGMGGRLDVFDCGSFELRIGRASLPTVSSFIPGESLPHLRDNLERLSLASLIVEVVDLLNPEHMGESTATYQQVITTLKALQASTDIREMLSVTFQSVANLLIDAGYLAPSAELGRGSTHQLLTLLHQVERAAERPLASRATLEKLVLRQL